MREEHDTPFMRVLKMRGETSGSYILTTTSYAEIFGKLASAPSVDEALDRRIRQQLMAEGLKPNTSKFTRRLERELRRQTPPDRPERAPRVPKAPKPVESEAARRARQEASRVRDEEEI